MSTGWACFRFAKVIYVMPLLFGYTHILLTGTPQQNAWAIISATLGIVLVSVVATGYLLIRTTALEWLLLAVAALLAFIPAAGTMISGVIIFAGVYMWQRKRAGDSAQTTTEPVWFLRGQRKDQEGPHGR
jgi:TRAP-type uncharacterized transport system fused permease subunit